MKKLLPILFFILLLAAPAGAVDTGALEEAVPEAAREVLGELSVSDLMDGGEGVTAKLWDWCGRDRKSVV